MGGGGGGEGAVSGVCAWGCLGEEKGPRPGAPECRGSRLGAPESGFRGAEGGDRGSLGRGRVGESWFRGRRNVGAPAGSAFPVGPHRPGGRRGVGGAARRGDHAPSAPRLAHAAGGEPRVPGGVWSSVPRCVLEQLLGAPRLPTGKTCARGCLGASGCCRRAGGSCTPAAGALGGESGSLGGGYLSVRPARRSAPRADTVALRTGPWRRRPGARAVPGHLGKAGGAPRFLGKVGAHR